MNVKPSITVWGLGLNFYFHAELEDELLRTVREMNGLNVNDAFVLFPVCHRTPGGVRIVAEISECDQVHPHCDTQELAVRLGRTVHKYAPSRFVQCTVRLNGRSNDVSWTSAQ